VVTRLRFRVADLLPASDPLSVPLLRLMAATNDTRQCLKQVIRAMRGGRRPRNTAEAAIKDGELLYLDRLLCGHLEEAARAFAGLWNEPEARARLRQVAVLDDAGRDALRLVEREFVQRQDGFRKTFLERIRHDWAFHYIEKVYASALKNAPETGEILVPSSRGLGRYVIVDDLVTHGVTAAAGKTPKAYDDAMKTAIRLADAIGRVVDGLLVGLVRERDHQISRRNYTVTLERAIARGRREAAARPTD
jgi:hypothetical protein